MAASGKTGRAYLKSCIEFIHDAGRLDSEPWTKKASGVCSAEGGEGHAERHRYLAGDGKGTLRSAWRLESVEILSEFIVAS